MFCRRAVNVFFASLLRIGPTVALAVLLVAGPARAQAVASPVLEGAVLLGDTIMSDGTVILHHLSGGSQGELDSLRVDEDGRFAFPLPSVPDPARSDVFFASVRHHGVLYFGPAITAAVQLDSVYEIHAYDTLVAPSEGFPVALQSRSVFFEPDSLAADWRVTDLFQIRNDEPRTVVARPGGRVWSYPLPVEAREVAAGEGELALDAAVYEDGDLVVRAALPPGERLFVVRYRVDSPALTIPLEGATEAMDILVREPAPPLAVEGLELLDRLELEEGSTYLRFAGADVVTPAVRITEEQEESPPKVQWAAVLLALILTGAGLLILRPAGAPIPAPAALDRDTLLLHVAQLDEDFEPSTASPAERSVYERRRAELIRKIRAEN